MTLPANQLMAEIHNVKNRMPAILLKEAFGLLKQYPTTHMLVTPVSTRVNTPKNNDAARLTPAKVAYVSIARTRAESVRLHRCLRRA